MTVVLAEQGPDKNHHRRSSIGRSPGMYLIRLDSAAIWTGQGGREALGERGLTRSKGEGTSVSGGNEAFATRTPILNPFCVLPNATFEPPRPDCGGSPNRTFYRPLSGGRVSGRRSRGRQCKSYLYSISHDQVNIFNGYGRRVSRAKLANPWQII